jgi:hypothetical protein
MNTKEVNDCVSSTNFFYTPHPKLIYARTMTASLLRNVIHEESFLLPFVQGQEGNLGIASMTGKENCARKRAKKCSRGKIWYI